MFGQRKYNIGDRVWVALHHDAEAGRVVRGIILSYDHGFYVVRADLGNGDHEFERSRHDLYPFVEAANVKMGKS